MYHWGKIYNLNPLWQEWLFACLALESLGSTGMEESSWETSRISNARGHPARGSMLPAAGLVAGGALGRKFWKKVLGESFGTRSVFPSSQVQRVPQWQPQTAS